MKAALDSMPRHVGEPYWRGGPAETSDRNNSDAFWTDRTARRCAAQMRELATAMATAPDTPQCGRRCEILRCRAAEIDAGQFNPTHHFRVIVPARSATVNKGRLHLISYPCRGCLLYTFDEAWLLLESFAARRGWSDGSRMECYAEGRGQNLTLGIIYDGIADPMREVPAGGDRA